MAALGATQATTTSKPVLASGTAVYGATLTFTSTVAPATQGGSTPTGTVTFTVDTVPGTAQPLNAGVATISLNLTAGTHTISAHYDGDGDVTYSASSSTELSQPVAKADTELKMSSNPAQFGQPVAIRAALTLVSPASGDISGKVAFTIYGHAISGCSAIDVQNGVAICNTSILLLGTLNVVATFSGDANTNPSTASLPISIGKVLAGTWAAFSPDAPVYGAPLTLNTLLFGVSGVAAPTGTVTYSEGTVILGTAPVGTDGRATLVLGSAASPVPLGAGTHTVTVAYSGDVNYQSSAAEPLQIVVTKAATTLALASATAQFGQPVTLKATAKVVSSGGGVPAGKITFSNGDTPITGCTAVSTVDGSASCATSFSQLGTLTINAAYIGDDNTAASTATMQLTVGKAAPGFYSAFTPAAPVFGAPVTVNALLLGASGIAAPTGTVTFSDGSTYLATITVGSDGKAPLVLPSASGTAGSTLPPLAVGTHSIVAVYNGDANYVAATATALSVVVGKAATSIALTSNSAQTGQAVSLAAAVSVVSPGSATPAGTLDFTVGGNAITACTGIAVQSGVGTCNTTLSQSGDYTIGVSYSGDANTAASTATMQLTVGKATPTVQAAFLPASPMYSMAVTVTTTLASIGGLPTPSGTVIFTVDTAAGVTVPVGADGRASLALSSTLAAGSHTVTSTYSGDTTYAAATASALAVVIAKAMTNTSLTASSGASLTATVALLPPASGAPTGMVQFFQSGLAIGTAPLAQVGVNFVATLTPASQTGSFWAVYQGDTNCAGSASQLATLTSSAQVSLSSDRNPSSAGQPVVFTVRVSGTTGAATPTGSVQLTSDGASLGTASLTDGLATLVATTLEVGSHTIVASYSGDSTYAAATATLVQVVSKSATSISLSADPQATVFGQPVTLTAQTGVSSGTVKFLDGDAALSSAQVASGTATLVVSTLPVGTHSLTASWTGDTASDAAVSAAVSLTVNKAQTVTKLEVSGSTLRAAVTAVAPGAGTPTGNVKFLDSATNLIVAAAALDAGVAATPTPSSAGSLVAVYGGDANFLASNSASVAALAALNAASYAKSSFAPDEIVTLFGSNLAATTESATSGSAKSLGGTTVTITDFGGAKYDADLLFVSPDQATFVMPAGIASGPATVVIANPGRSPLSVTVTVAPVAPGIFTLNSTGEGVAAAQAIRVRAGGIQDAPQQVGIFDKTQNLWIPMPIDLGDPGDTVYLMLYGTGLRHYSQPPVCTIGGQKVTIAYAGAQGGFAGVDQVNLVLPQSLRGAGTVDLTLTVDGVTSNIVTLAFQ